MTKARYDVHTALFFAHEGFLFLTEKLGYANILSKWIIWEERL